MRALILALGIVLAGGQAFAQSAPFDRLKAVQSDPAALKAAIEAGKKAAFFCVNCHGDDGISKIADVPNLAGQNPGYLLEQIRKFGSGERKDQFMQGLIKVLKDEERVQITLYYSNVVVPPSAADAKLVAKGKDLFFKLCARCHGEQAYGNELFPRLAGQHVAYIKKSVTRYRDGTGIRNNQLMSIATSNLKDEEITALANYLTQLQ